MKDKITAHIHRIEKEKGIKVLLACETGSRAWGFASTDSDFDIRLIYVHPSDWYLSLFEKIDTIDIMLEDNLLDITGWELRKALNLLRKSNAPILERIQSPIKYFCDENFVKDIMSVAPSCYSKIATMHHYLSMAKKKQEEISQDTYKLKSFFYALRTALMCRWIMQKNTIPPIQFEVLLHQVGLEQHLQHSIIGLMILKSQKDEHYFHQGELPLKNLIQQCINEADAIKNNLPASKPPIDNLEKILRKYVQKYDNTVT